MKSYKKIMCIVLGACVLFGCGKKAKPSDGDYAVYYINTEENTLGQQWCDLQADSADAQIEQLLEEMKKKPGDSHLHSVFENNPDVDIETWTLEEGKLQLHFNEVYQELAKEDELLLRAAVVKTFIQVSDVTGVEFYVADDPLTQGDGIIVGRMTEESFVQNIGSSLHSYEKAKLILYFANKEKNKLVPCEVNVRYNSNTSKEKLIVEQLLKGPSEAGMNAVIPGNTVLLGVSIKDHICYVNLDEGFLNMTDIDPNLTIYALANSLIDGGDVRKVQILVGGESNIKYQGVVDLSKPFEKDMELVEEEND